MEEWRQRETAFMGKVTAGATHELRNVLAIIGECAGLVEDLLEIDGRERIDERVRERLSLISRQIARGNRILTSLNLFAHSADQHTAHVDVRRTVDTLLALADRFLRRKSASCKLSSGDSPSLATHPIRFQMVLFSVLMSLVEDLPAPARVFLSVQKRKDGVRLSMFPETEEGMSGFSALGALLKDRGFRGTLDALGASVRVDRGVVLDFREKAP